MKRLPIYRVSAFFFALLASSLLMATSCVRIGKVIPTVRIMTYSSLGAKGGFLPEIKSSFEVDSGCTLEIETTLGAAQMVSMLSDSKVRPTLDAVMGVDEILAERLKSEWVPINDLGLESLRLKDRVVGLLADRLRFGFIPLDYGALTFIYRKSEFKGGSPPIVNRGALVSPEMRKKFIVQDPRASSPGLMFFLFATEKVSIPELKSQWLTIAPSWDSSYKMFLAKDAPMVWSYLSSLAYHASKGERADYGYIDFEEGLPLQVEGIGVLKNAHSNPCLKKWLLFLLRPETLARLSEKQWMKPAYRDVKEPKFFDQIPEVKKAAVMDLRSSVTDVLISRFGRDLQGESR